MPLFGKPSGLTPSTNTQNTQQTNESQQTTAKISESLSKIVGRKQKWEQGLPTGFESGQKIKTQLSDLLKKGSHTSKNDKISKLLKQLDPEIKQRVEQYGFPTHDRNGSEYSRAENDDKPNFGGILHFEWNSQDYKDTNTNSNNGPTARLKIRTALALGILLQVPESDLQTLRGQLCQGTDQDRDNAIEILASKVRENFERVDDFSRVSNLLKKDPRRLSLSTARDYDETRQLNFAPTKFTSTTNHDRKNYRLQVHMLQQMNSVNRYVIDNNTGKIKDSWPDSARVLSTSVISQNVGTTWGDIGLSLRVDPKRVIVSHPGDFQSKLQKRPEMNFYNEAHKKRIHPNTDLFSLKSVDTLLNGGTIHEWNEVVVQGGTPGTGDPEPEGTVQITGVVVYEQATNEDREFAKKIAKANDLLLLELGDRSLTQNCDE